MDIVIENLSRGFLKRHIDSFIKILKNEPFEYWTEEHFVKELPLKFELSIMATINNQLVGYILASKKVEVIYIHKFMVDPIHRGMQIGGKLQKAFEQSLIRFGYNYIQLSVISNNINAIRFYEKNGYFIIENKMDTINHIELITMRKIL